MLLGIKDQNWWGKVLLCGTDSTKLAVALDPILRATGHVTQGRDTYDRMWDVAWCGTHITSGSTMMSFTSQWFPNGKLLVQMFDAFSEHGWILVDGPNFGGSTPNNGTVSWPVFVFRRGTKVQNLVLAVKDQNLPTKVLAAGPEDAINSLKIGLTETLQSITPSVTCETDAYDNDTWDAVWQHTQMTTGATLLSVQSPYFPIGKTVLAVLEEVYSTDWRLVCAPNFGGDTVAWPVFVFQKSEAPKPNLLLMAVKDQNIVGKVCLAGEAAGTVAEKLKEAFAPLPGVENVEIRKDKYDGDWDAVLRNTQMTKGFDLLSLNCRYFPRNDAMMALLTTTGSLGYSVAACPNFVGNQDSWPTFVFEETGVKTEPAFIAIKDENLPGKVCVGGARDALPGLLDILRSLTGPIVEMNKDQWDQDYDDCLQNTVMTSGLPCFSFLNLWWPYGYMVEVVLGEMSLQGWTLVGGPNFGGEGASWPSFVFQRILET